jgi:4-hydroxybenzoate polyprenyltransferase
VLALVWSFVTVVLPAIENKVNMNQIWYLFIERMIFILAISIPFDIRDLERDKFQNTLTIPGAIGVNQSKVFAIVMILVFLFLSLVNYNWTYVSFSRIATSLIAVLFILSFQRIKDELVFLFILDGIMILHALNIVLIKNFCS